MSEETQVWTDGSYSEKTGHGGWAWVSRASWNAGHCIERASSGVMELRAILEALRNNPGPLVIYSDHLDYCRRLSKSRAYLREWLAGSSRDREKLSHGLLVLIYQELEGRHVRFEHVYGHAGDKYNERAHKLANNARLSV